MYQRAHNKHVALGAAAHGPAPRRRPRLFATLIPCVMVVCLLGFAILQISTSMLISRPRGRLASLANSIVHRDSDMSTAMVVSTYAKQRKRAVEVRKRAARVPATRNNSFSHWMPDVHLQPSHKKRLEAALQAELLSPQYAIQAGVQSELETLARDIMAVEAKARVGPSMRRQAGIHPLGMLWSNSSSGNAHLPCPLGSTLMAQVQSAIMGSVPIYSSVRGSNINSRSESIVPAMSFLLPIKASLTRKVLRRVLRTADLFRLSSNNSDGTSTAIIHIVSTASSSEFAEEVVLGPALSGLEFENASLKRLSEEYGKFMKKTSAIDVVRVPVSAKLQSVDYRLAFRSRGMHGEGDVLFFLSCYIEKQSGGSYYASISGHFDRHWWELLPLMLADAHNVMVGSATNQDSSDPAHLLKVAFTHRVVSVGPDAVPIHRHFGANMQRDAALIGSFSDQSEATSTEAIVSKAVLATLQSQRHEQQANITESLTYVAHYRTLLGCRVTLEPANDGESLYTQHFGRSSSDYFRRIKTVSDGINVAKGKEDEPLLFHSFGSFPSKDDRSQNASRPMRVAIPSPYCFSITAAALADAMSAADAIRLNDTSDVIASGPRKGQSWISWLESAASNEIPIESLFITHTTQLVSLRHNTDHDTLKAEGHHQQQQGAEAAFINMELQRPFHNGGMARNGYAIGEELARLRRNKPSSSSTPVGLFPSEQHRMFFQMLHRLVYEGGHGCSVVKGNLSSGPRSSTALSSSAFALCSSAPSFPLRCYSSPVAIVVRGVLDRGDEDSGSAFNRVGSFFDKSTPNHLITIDVSKSEAHPNTAIPATFASYLYWKHLCNEDDRGCSWWHSFWHENAAQQDALPSQIIKASSAPSTATRSGQALALFTFDVINGRPHHQLEREYGSIMLGSQTAMGLNVPLGTSQTISEGHLAGVSVTWETFCVKCFGFSTELMHYLSPLEHQVNIYTPHKAHECFCEGQPYSFEHSLVRVAAPKRFAHDFAVAPIVVGARHEAELEEVTIKHTPLRAWEADYRADESRFTADAASSSGQFFEGAPISEKALPLLPELLKINIVHKDPGSWPRRQGSNENTIWIGRAMFEATSLPSNWIAYANEMHEIWVPTRFSRYIFEKEGFDPSKLVIMPEPIDTHFYDPATVAPLLLPQALHAGHWRHEGNRDSYDSLMASGEGAYSPLNTLRNDLSGLSANPEQAGLSSTLTDLSSNYKFLGVFKWEERKAWKALIEAYCRAFEADDPVSLYLVTYKYGDSGRNPDSIINDIRQYVRTILVPPVGEGWRAYAEGQDSMDGFSTRLSWPKNMPHIEVITEQISEEEMVLLYRSADAFVMPTRGEGWGLPIIQGMAMALPTITTAFSGMLDFITTAENSLPTAYLVSFELTGIKAGSGVGSGNEADQGAMFWADPEIRSLTRAMRTVFEDPDAAEEVGRNARRHIVTHFSEEAIAELVKARLRYLREEHRSRLRQEVVEERARHALHEGDQGGAFLL